MQQEADKPSEETIKDPVCGMTVDPAKAPSCTHEETTYYFCCQRCHDRFVEDPEQFLDPKAREDTAANAPAGTIWTCPMHPEILLEEPMPCPLC